MDPLSALADPLAGATEETAARERSNSLKSQRERELAQRKAEFDAASRPFEAAKQQGAMLQLSELLGSGTTVTEAQKESALRAAGSDVGRAMELIFEQSTAAGDAEAQEAAAAASVAAAPPPPPPSDVLAAAAAASGATGATGAAGAAGAAGGTAQSAVSLASAAMAASLGHVYEVMIAEGSLGIVVDNLLERTVVIKVTRNSAAALQGVAEGSMILSVNAQNVELLTHRQTLALVTGSSRPLLLRLRQLAPAEVQQLVRQRLACHGRPGAQGGGYTGGGAACQTARQLLNRAAAILQLLPLPSRERLAARLAPRYVGEDGEEEQPEAEAEGGGGGSFARLLEALDAAVQGGAAEEAMLHCLADALPAFNGAVLVSDDDGGGGGDDDDDGGGGGDRSSPEAAEGGESAVLARHIELLLAIAEHGTRTGADQPGPAAGVAPLWRQALVALADLLAELEAVPAAAPPARHQQRADAVAEAVVLCHRLCAGTATTPREAVCPLLAPLHRHADEQGRVQLRGVLERACADASSWERRRAACRALPDLAAAPERLQSLAMVEWAMALFATLAADSAENVRRAALDVSVALAQRVPAAVQQAAPGDPDKLGHLALQQVVPVLFALAQDDAAAIRAGVSERCIDILLSMGSARADVLVDMFLGLLRDADVSVRNVAVVSLPRLAEGVMALAEQEQLEDEDSPQAAEVAEAAEQPDGSGDSSSSASSAANLRARRRIAQSIVPAVFQLTAASAVGSRLAAVETLMVLLALLGPEFEHVVPLVPICLQLLEDSARQVRAALVFALVDSSGSLPPPFVELVLCPALDELCSVRQWRARSMVLQCVVQVSENLGAQLPVGFTTLVLRMLRDEVGVMRTSAARELANLARNCGEDWFRAVVLQQLMGLLEGEHHGRCSAAAVLGEVCAALGEEGGLAGGSQESSAAMLCDEVLPILLEAAADRVAVMRIAVVRALGMAAVALLSLSGAGGHAKAAVALVVVTKRLRKQARSDDDPDVRFFAVEAMRPCPPLEGDDAAEEEEEEEEEEEDEQKEKEEEEHKEKEEEEEEEEEEVVGEAGAGLKAAAEVVVKEEEEEEEEGRGGEEEEEKKKQAGGAEKGDKAARETAVASVAQKASTAEAEQLRLKAEQDTTRAAYDATRTAAGQRAADTTEAQRVADEAARETAAASVAQKASAAEAEQLRLKAEQDTTRAAYDATRTAAGQRAADETAGAEARGITDGAEAATSAPEEEEEKAAVSAVQNALRCVLAE